MKIKLFTIPNLLTLANLVCGTIALIEIILNQNYFFGFILIVAAAAFDFLDGFTARLLGQYSEVGRELDSLSDVVSFGLVPSVAMFGLFNLAEKSFDNPLWSAWGAYLSLLIVCFSALRLAKFNVDSTQESSFEGLPTPANALFCLSLGMLIDAGKLTLSAEVIALTSVVMAFLLIAPLRLFALKFKSLGWRENRVRYIFLLLALLSVIIFREFSLLVIIAIYVLISLGECIFCRSKKRTLNKIDE
ncbi:MAG: CDP-alcohol phosphatidyltransferase family protein [Rikenellaceae bacterium]